MAKPFKSATSATYCRNRYSAYQNIISETRALALFRTKITQFLSIRSPVRLAIRALHSIVPTAAALEIEGIITAARIYKRMTERENMRYR